MPGLDDNRKKKQNLGRGGTVKERTIKNREERRISQGTPGWTQVDEKVAQCKEGGSSPTPGSHRRHSQKQASVLFLALSHSSSSGLGRSLRVWELSCPPLPYRTFIGHAHMAFQREDHQTLGQAQFRGIIRKVFSLRSYENQGPCSQSARIGQGLDDLYCLFQPEHSISCEYSTHAL